MTVIYIPPKERKTWRGIFPSEFQGDFSQSWNIDLERFPGKLCLSGPSKVLFRHVAGDTTTVFGTPIGFVTSGADGTNRIWGITSSSVIRSGVSELVGWSADTHANTPTTGATDIITHGDTDITDTAFSKDRVLVALNTTIVALNAKTTERAWDTDWWSAAADTSGGLAQGALDVAGATTPHIFGKIQQQVIVTDGDAIHTIDKSDVVVRRRITFPPGYTATCIYMSKNTYWIGLKRTAGGNGMILSWDGSAAEYSDYGISGTPISGWVRNGIPYFINQFGQILALDGYDFNEVKHFPIFEERILFALTDIHRNGCALDGTLVKIFVSAPQFSTRMRSGIWIYDQKNDNLYHHASISDYDDTTARIDFGQGIIAASGPIFNTGDPTNRTIIGALHYKSYTGTTQVALHYFASGNSKVAASTRGYFVSPIIPATEVQDIFQKLWLKFRQFAHGDNRVIVKFRTVDPLFSASQSIGFLGKPVQPSNPAIWVSDTHFRIDSPNSVPAEVRVGHEVEVMAGRNSGCLFHITAITDTNGAAVTTPSDTTTVDISVDEAAPSGDTFQSLVRFDNWTKIDIISDTSISFHEFTLPGADTNGNALNAGDFVQFKVELRGRLMEIDEYQVVSKPSIIAE